MKKLTKNEIIETLLIWSCGFVGGILVAVSFYKIII